MACDMPTINYRSLLFGQILHPARDGVRKVLKRDVAEVFIFPATGTFDVWGVDVAVTGLPREFARPRALDMDLCAKSPALYSDTVTAICTPEGFNATDIVTYAADIYSVAFGIGLGEVAGKVFRIGHLGSLTDVMTFSGIAAAEMCMADFDLQIQMGSGVAAAQDYYRGRRPTAHPV